MTAQEPIGRGIDYSPCHYGTSRNLFRGPRRRLRGDYVVCLGGTETFGRFIETPFPALVEAQLGLPVVNLGCQKAGIDVFLGCPSLIDICAMAKATVIQVMGAPNMSNRHYTVDPRRNDRFLRASKTLKTIYPEVDFRRFETTAGLLTGLARVCPKRLHIVRQELQTAWVARMRSLIEQSARPVILLWASDHAPYSKASGGTICREPVFVDRAMLDAAAARADALVEVVVPPGEIAAGQSDMAVGPCDAQAAQGLLGHLAHRRIADAVAGTLARHLGPAAPPAAPDAPLVLRRTG